LLEMENLLKIPLVPSSSRMTFPYADATQNPIHLMLSQRKNIPPLRRQ
jgi:hypothetical protein